MKKLADFFRKYIYLATFVPMVSCFLLSVFFVYDKQVEQSYHWLENQSAIYESVVKRYILERQADINTLSSNLSLISRMESQQDGRYKFYLKTFLSNYEYQSLLILDSDKNPLYKEYDQSSENNDAMESHLLMFAHKLDNQDLGKVVLEYFSINNELFGIVAKKTQFENGDIYYYFLSINNEHLNDILFTSTSNVDSVVSYLVNRNTNGEYFFLTDVIQGNQRFKYGDKSDATPIYWKLAQQEHIRDSFIYNDLSDNEALVFYTKLKMLDEEFILISKIDVRTLFDSMLDYLYYISIFLLIFILIAFYYFSRFNKVINYNVNNIVDFCENICSGKKVRRVTLSDFQETKSIKNSLIRVYDYLHLDEQKKAYEIKMEKELRETENIQSFARKSIVLINQMVDVSLGAFYLKNDDKFELVAQYFSSMDKTVSEDQGVIGQCYELNKVVQIKGEIIAKSKLHEGAHVDVGYHVIYPSYYLFVPIIADKNSLHSGVLVLAIERKLDTVDLEFVDKARVNLALIMSFVAQKQNIASLLEQTKQREKELDELNQELTFLSRNDVLTGISNRFYGEYLLEKELNSADVSESLSLLMFDVDHFKKYNDTYGHVAGDKCLKRVAQCLNDMGLRNDDFFFRYGGEEFVVVLPNTSEKNAMQVAERLRSSVQEMAIPHKSSLTSDSVTISVGVYTLNCPATHIESVEQLIQKVDENLYLAKKTRNCVSNGDIALNS